MAGMTKAPRLEVLRMIRAYMTVSGEAAEVIAGTLPADLVARGRARLHALKSQDLEEPELSEGHHRVAEENLVE